MLAPRQTSSLNGRCHSTTHLEDIVLYPRNARGEVDDGEQSNTTERAGVKATATMLSVELLTRRPISPLPPVSNLLAEIFPL